MHRSRARFAFVAVLSLAAAARAREAATPATLLVAGPLRAPPALLADHPAVRAVEPVVELPLEDLWPAAGDTFAWLPGEEARWTAVAATVDGYELPTDAAPGLTWFAAYLACDRHGKVEFEVTGAGQLGLYVDGASRGAGGAPGDADTKVTAAPWLRCGTHRIVVRVERSADATATLVLTASADGGLRFGIDPAHAPADPAELDGLASISDLRLAPDGTLLALRRRGAGAPARQDVLEVASGRVVAASLGGPDARPVEWRPDGGALAFRAGDDLFLWHRADGRVERLLEGEPGLGAVSFAPDGSFLVFASTRGLDADEEPKVRRRQELREKLSDWPTAPHLHLLMIGSGARRRLAVPGDWVQDAFAVLPDGRSLVYLRSLPAPTRPWFITEFHMLDLTSGADRAIASVRMGFENRPGLGGMAVAPDGRRLAFVGPPAELGEGAASEPNAFDPDLFVLDLASGAWSNVTRDLTASVAGHVRWGSDARTLWFAATEGARQRIVHARFADDPAAPAAFASEPAGGAAVHDVAVAADGAFAAVASSFARLPALYVRPAGAAAPRVLLAPNEEIAGRLVLAEPVAFACTGADGTPLDAWLYRPARDAASVDPLPLVVYFYGGATPTTQGFNLVHQALVASGYAVFVVNPRGAHGYGRAFADSHVADWGERAGADVLAAVAAVLEQNDDLDPAAVGCYGGSYGGFMTMWLLAQAPERFAAAVSLYGISNLASYFGEGTWGFTYGDQAMARKYPWTDPEWYRAHSPVFLADRIRTPLLLLHGDADTNVPPGESEQMFTALRLLGRPVELVRFAGEDHGLRGSKDNRIAHRRMLIEWFDRHLRGRPEAWDERWGDSNENR